MPKQVNAKIIVSFAMVNHGWAFATWLRDRLMKQYKLYQVEDVYVDFVASRQFDVEPEEWGTKVKVGLDTRATSRESSGARPIGAMREDWNDLFTGAMRTSRAMIVVLTAEYLRSKWCKLEATQAIAEQERRQREGLPDLKIVVLQLSQLDLAESRALFGSNAQLIRASYIDGEQRGLLWDKGAWRVSDQVMASLVSKIGEHV